MAAALPTITPTPWMSPYMLRAEPWSRHPSHLLSLFLRQQWNLDRRFTLHLSCGGSAPPSYPSTVLPADASQDTRRDYGLSALVEIELQVRDYELDQLGVVNNAVYSSYCQHGVHELLNKFGMNADTIARSGNALGFSEVTHKFIAPLKSGDTFTVMVKFTRFSVARIFAELFIFKSSNQQAIHKGKATIVYLNKSYRPSRLPSEVMYKLTQSGVKNTR